MNNQDKTRVKMLSTFSDHNGTLYEGDQVTIDEYKKEGKVRVIDCFGKSWVIPEECLPKSK